MLDIRCSEKFRLFRKKPKILGLSGCAVPESSGSEDIFYVQIDFLALWLAPVKISRTRGSIFRAYTLDPASSSTVVMTLAHAKLLPPNWNSKIHDC